MPCRGSTLPLEKYAQQILALIGERPDLTLDEVVLVLRKRRIAGSRSARSRDFSLVMASPSKKPSRTASACGRRNGRGLSSWWEGAADGFLVAVTP